MCVQSIPNTYRIGIALHTRTEFIRTMTDDMSDKAIIKAEQFPSAPEDEESMTVSRDWTDDEERRAKRKWVNGGRSTNGDATRPDQLLFYIRLDLIIMPLLFLGFFCLRTFKNETFLNAQT